MAAITAGRRGRRVTVLERNPDIGRKIRISGGGRCNFTNVSVDLPRSFHSSAEGRPMGPGREQGGGGSNFFRRALEQYPPTKFVAMVESHGIKFHEKKLGQLFCDRSAQQLVEMLRQECRAAGVEIQTGAHVSRVSMWPRLASGEPVGTAAASPANLAVPRFTVHCRRAAAGGGEEEHEEGEKEKEEALYAETVVVASGGLSYARSCGATDLAHRVAADFGIQVRGVRPGLVPLLLPEDEAWARGLAGVSLEVCASMGSASFVENLLFTHRGLSGPAILQVSSFWRPPAARHAGHARATHNQEHGSGGIPTVGGTLVLDLVPHESEAQVLAWLEDLRQRDPTQPVVQALRARFPGRFAAAFWAARAAPACVAARDARLKDLAPPVKERLAHLLKNWELPVVGTEGYPKAEVTCGGVATEELCDATMEALRCPGLYFVGEAVDVTGWLGGYNLQWAWASGYAAGLVC